MRFGRFSKWRQHFVFLSTGRNFYLNVSRKFAARWADEKEARLAHFLSHRKAFCPDLSQRFNLLLERLALALSVCSTVDIKMHVAPCVTSINSRAAFSLFANFATSRFRIMSAHDPLDAISFPLKKVLALASWKLRARTEIFWIPICLKTIRF